MAYKTVKELLTAICDSIRARNDTIELINHQDIPNALDACPFAVSGVFVPSEDTKIFEIDGLSFAPTSLFIMCSDECVSSGSGSPLSIVCVNKPKELGGFVQHRDTSLTVNIAYLGTTSSMFEWGVNGVKVTIPIDRYFKKGLVYNYYISGGGE